MATLHVDGVPDDLYGRLEELATASSRSLGGEVVALLDEAVNGRVGHSEHARALASLLNRRRVFTKKEDMPDSTELLREDRAR